MNVVCKGVYVYDDDDEYKRQSNSFFRIQYRNERQGNFTLLLIIPPEYTKVYGYRYAPCCICSHMFFLFNTLGLEERRRDGGGFLNRILHA